MAVDLVAAFHHSRVSGGGAQFSPDFFFFVCLGFCLVCASFASSEMFE
jgi:hypothetical protein